MDDEPIPSVHFNPVFKNNLVSVGEDGLMAMINVESNPEDDEYIVINLEEAGMRAGHIGYQPFAISMNAVQKWIPNEDDLSQAPVLAWKHQTSVLEHADYFVNVEAYNGLEWTIAGLHSGGVTLYDDAGVPRFRSEGLHSETVRDAKILSDVLVTAGEDGRVVAS
jgi:hypothetical protein